MLYYLIFSASSVFSVIGSAVLFKRYQLKAGTGMRAMVYYLIANGSVSAVIPLIILLASGQQLQIATCSLIYAASLVLASTLNNYFTLRAYETGHVAIANTFSVIGSLLLSCVWGVAFLNETLKLVQVIGILLIFAAVLLIARKNQGAIGKGQWLNLAMVFLGAGAINVLSKLHQVETVHATVDTLSFSIWVALIRTVIFGAIAPFMGKQRKAEGKISWSATLYAYGYSVIGGGTYIITLWLAKILPITITTPLSTAISLVLAAVFAWVFHKERLSRAEVLTILLSLAGVLLIVQ
jgi:drug/metabolite transporter (DMT)-like permease